MTTILEKRVAAAQATLNHFKGKPFKWGATDCATLAAHLLRQLGHAPPLRSFGVYQTALGAKRALKRKGFADMGEVLDGLGYARIPPAAALPGDIIGLDGEGDLALTIFLGNGRVLGFISASEGVAPRAEVMQPFATRSAWRTV